MEKICICCNKVFVPSKYRVEKQTYCSSPDCQYVRQLRNMKTWRDKNPGYFKRDGTNVMETVQM